MIPLKDDAPRLSAPLVNYFLIAANVLVFLFQSFLDRRSQIQFVYAFGLVPARVATLFHATVPYAHTHGSGTIHAVGISPEAALIPILTSMFMHSDIWHILFNMWFLWIFGRTLEGALGHFPYLGFYFACGVAAACAQIMSDVGSVIPMVGASGAIAGVMGGYFTVYPRARVLMLVPFLFIFFIWLPAWVVLGYWFVLQFLSGVGTALVTSRDSGGVAFWAHVGGFVSGVLLIGLFPSHRKSNRYGY